ncbi:MAG: heme-binding domain-containing protein, partial [Planctomycetia bacterium]|nr:heme-binding domain-containing protein [Planctomycetia bacterium]
NKGGGHVKLLIWHGPTADLGKFIALAKDSPSEWRVPPKPPAKPEQELITKGMLGADDGPFAVDTFTLPYENPHKSLMFVSGVDFLPGGELVVCTAHGDVWIAKPLDERLEKIVWKRFASGLYQPLGLKVVDGNIMVLERGQLTTLRDRDEDFQADGYMNTCGDWDTGGGEHSFDTCLEMDQDRNVFFFKTGDTHTPTGGCLMRVPLPKDGKVFKSEVFDTGFRHPIGLGMSPDGIVSGADQEGNWMPATRLDRYQKGGFYGDMRAHHRATPPKIYDAPLCWLPRQLDNSAGGQVWVPKGQWGPLGGKMLHLSYGRCRVMQVLQEEVDGQHQGGAVNLGLNFLSGVCRGRFHPKDGHLYLVGLKGWQTASVEDGCVQRVRYTGKKMYLPTSLSVHADGIRLAFSQPLDKASAADPKRYRIEQWNYRWSGDYGSKRWSVAEPSKIGQDTVPVQSVQLLPDGQSVFLRIKGLQPVMQMQLHFDLTAADGQPLAGDVFNTIHKLGKPALP